MEEAREELDEFQLSSRELEAELEAQLEQAEGKNKELLSANGRLTMEVEMLRVSPCFTIVLVRNDVPFKLIFILIILLII